MLRNEEHSKEHLQETAFTVSITKPGAASYIMAYLQHAVLVRSNRKLGAQIYPLSPTEYQVVIPFQLDREQLLTFLQEINKCPNSEGRGQLNALVNVIFQKVKYVISTKAMYKVSAPVQVRQLFRPTSSVESLNLFVVGFPVCTCTLRIKELMLKGGVTLSAETRMSWLQGQGDPYYTLRVIPDTKEMRDKLLLLPTTTPNWAEYGLSLMPEASCQVERLRLIADLSYKLSHLEPDRSPPPEPILTGAQLGAITYSKLLNLLPVKDTGPPAKLPSPAPPPRRAGQVVNGTTKAAINAADTITLDDGFEVVQGRRRQKGGTQDTIPATTLVRTTTKPKFSEVVSDEEEVDPEEGEEDRKVEKDLCLTDPKGQTGAPRSILTPESPKTKGTRSRGQQVRYLESLVVTLAVKFNDIAVNREDRKKILRDYVATLSLNMEETIEHLKGILLTAEGKEKEREMFNAYVKQVKEGTQDSKKEGESKGGETGKSITKKMNFNNQQLNVEIAKVIEHLVDAHTNIAATPKERKRAIYRFTKQLALEPVAILDLLKEIQQGRGQAQGLLDKFLKEESDSKQPALQPVPTGSATAACPASAVTTTSTTSTTTIVTDSAIAGASLDLGCTVTEDQEKDEATSKKQPASRDMGIEENSEAGREEKGDGQGGGEDRVSACDGLVPMATDDPPSGSEEAKVSGGEAVGLGKLNPSDGIPPLFFPQCLPSSPSSQTFSTVSGESETPCPISDNATQTPIHHASVQTPPLSGQ